MSFFISYFSDPSVYRKKKKNFYFLLYFILRFASIFFSFISFFRNFLYDKKILKTKKANLPVISVGNIVIGGGGKTPFILFLMKHLKGEKIAVISRGYKAKAEKLKRPMFITNYEKTFWQDVGDETQMIREHFPEMIYCVGANKVFSAQKVKEKKANLVLLDDGMQHRKLFRDLDLVLVNGKEFTSEPNIFPYGLLRENPKALKRADYVIIYTMNEKNILKIKKEILAITQVPIIVLEPYLQEIKNLKKKKIVEKIEKAALFCAIANPDRFYHLITQNNIFVVSKKYFLDHDNFTKKSLYSFAKKAKEKGAKCLLCTEKDAIKLFDSNLQLELPIFYVEISLKIIEGQFYWDSLIEKIKKMSYS